MVIVPELLQDPISRLYAVMSLLIVAVSSILAVNHNLAQDALLAAKTARPFPYTSQMAAVDNAEHLDLHRDYVNREREFLNAKLETIVQSFHSLLQSLEIPPDEVKRSLDRCNNRLYRVERDFAVFKAKTFPDGDAHSHTHTEDTFFDDENALERDVKP